MHLLRGGEMKERHTRRKAEIRAARVLPEVTFTAEAPAKLRAIRVPNKTIASMDSGSTLLNESTLNDEGGITF
jgi:hypothetical protein